MRQRTSLLLAGLFVAGVTARATAQQTTEPLAEASAAPLAEPARQRAAAAQAAPAVPVRRERPGAYWDRRPRFRIGDSVRLELTARVQSVAWLHDDLVVPGDEPPLADRISVPRKRVGLSGSVGGRFSFQAEREVARDGPWRDLYGEFRVSRALRVRVGHFKVPFSVERMTSGYDLDFIERAAASTALAPLRAVGVMARGRVADQALEYEAAVLRSDTSLRLWQTGPARSLAGRLVVAPLRDGRSRGSSALRLSVAALQGTSEPGRHGVVGETAMGARVFEPMFVNGTHRRLSAAAEFDSRAFSARGEWLRSTQRRAGQALDGGDLADLVGMGWYASGTWHAVRARRRMGTLDLAVRLDRLSFGSDGRDEPFLNPRADHVAPVGTEALTIGANLFMSRWVKAQANVVRERLRDPLRLLPLGPGPLWSTTVRVQIAM